MKFSESARKTIECNGVLAFYNSSMTHDSERVKKAAWLLTFGFVDTAADILGVDKNDVTH